MGIKVDLLLTVLAVHLNAVVSTDCGRDLLRCKSDEFHDCSVTTGDCSSMSACQPSYHKCLECDRNLVTCKAAVFESCSVSTGGCSTVPCQQTYNQCIGCPTLLARCLEKCSRDTIRCRTHARECFSDHNQCKAAEIDAFNNSAASLVEHSH